MRRALTTLFTLFALVSPAVDAQAKKTPPDHGRILAAAMEVAPHKLKDTTNLADTTNYVFRGRIITLNKEKTVHLCFDTEHMRVAGAWVGKYPAYKADKNMGPTLEGTMLFATKPGPGWAKEKNWKDPREHPEGPLPRNWAHYKGICQQPPILQYTVGATEVLEMPGCVEVGDHVAISRTFRLDPTVTRPSILLCEEAGAKNLKSEASFDASECAQLVIGKERIVAAALDAPKGSTWEVAAGRVMLHLPPLPKGGWFRVIQARLPEDRVKDFDKLLRAAGDLADPARLTSGGDIRWKETFVTKGTLSTSKDEPYVVDLIDIPEDNPIGASIRFAGLDFFPDGRCALCTWDGDVWIVSGLDDKLDKITWKRFAAGLQQPLGLKIIEGVIFTAGRDQITRLHDLNNDGEADYYENFNNDPALTLQRHEFVMDLQTDKEGNLYYCRSGHYITSATDANCCIYKLSPDGKKIEVIARGFREPNGLGIGPDGTITVGDNEGNGIPQTPLYHIQPGRFYGYTPQPKPGAVGGSWKYTEKPIVWLPKNVDRSAGGQVWVTGDKFGPLKGQMLHLSYGHCVLFNVLLDRKGEPWQGAVWKLPCTFQSGIMRARFSPSDGQLYLCGLRGWDTTSTKDGQFCRVRYTGKKVPMPVGLQVTEKGIDVTFTDPLDRKSAEDDQNWAGEWSDPIGKTSTRIKGKEEMPISGVRLSEDGKTVSVDLEKVLPASNYTLQYRVLAAEGTRISGRLDGTIHRAR